MQLLFESSTERGDHCGLAILPGVVKRFQLPSEFKIPHMGWNQGILKRKSPLIEPTEASAHYYFVHSYYVCPTDSEMVVLECDYGHPFCAMVSHQNVHATQFHPEKSQRAGLAIVRAFSKLP